jgi:hypothetical protein
MSHKVAATRGNRNLRVAERVAYVVFGTGGRPATPSATQSNTKYQYAGKSRPTADQFVQLHRRGHYCR